MNFIKITSAVFFALTALLWLPNEIAKFKVSRSDEFANVVVRKLPNCESGYKNKFIKIEYQGDVHILRTSCKYVAGLIQGQQIRMRHKEGTDVFLFEHQDRSLDLISVLLIAMITLTCFVISLKRKTAK